MGVMQDGLILEITVEYEKQIIVPKDKPLHQFILCPVGLVGSGKTTVVKPLSEKLNLVRISGDEVRKILKEKGYGYENLNQILRPLLEKYLAEGHSLCIDRDCVSPSAKKFLLQVEASGKAKLVWVHINPPGEFILNKLTSHEGGWLGNEALVENYHERKALHQNLDLPFTYTFDTSKQDLETQIDEAAQIIKKVTGN